MRPSAFVTTTFICDGCVVSSRHNSISIPAAGAPRVSALFRKKEALNTFVGGELLEKEIWLFDDEGRLRVAATINDLSGGAQDGHSERLLAFRWTDGPEPKITTIFVLRFDEDAWTVKRWEAATQPAP